MNKKTLLLFLSFFISTFGSSFAQIDSATTDEQNSSYSNIPQYAEQKEAIAPCQTTLNLATTFEFYAHKDNYKQHVTLEVGQELVVYVNNPSHAANANMPDFHAANSYKNGGKVSDSFNNISCRFLTLNWGGWNNFFYQSCPLEEVKDLNTDGNPLSYHFKATHSGVTKLIVTQNTLFLVPAGGVIVVTVK